MPSFGAELQRLMTEKGFVQKQLADAVGVSQTFIGKLIRGEQQEPRPSVLYKLCDALGVSCDHFRPFLAEGELPPAPAAEPEKPAKKGKK